MTLTSVSSVISVCNYKLNFDFNQIMIRLINKKNKIYIFFDGNYRENSKFIDPVLAMSVKRAYKLRALIIHILFKIKKYLQFILNCLIAIFTHFAIYLYFTLYYKYFNVLISKFDYKVKKLVIFFLFYLMLFK